MTTKPKTVVELFEGHPERWTQGTFSRDAAGNVTRVSSPHTMCWCLSGAIWFIYDGPEFSKAVMRVAMVLDNHGCDLGIAAWQDRPEHTFEEVFAVAKQAQI